MRELLPARLTAKRLLSAPAQCYHLTFALPPQAAEAPQAGQFFSFVAPDAGGKPYTRAYSVASTARPEQGGGYSFDLCVNRVENGFFSNLLCNLEPGASVSCHGPHGLFTLSAEASSYLFVAESTGIAPIRSFLQALAADPVPAHLLYWAPCAEELFYDEELRELAEQLPGFVYVPVVVTEAEGYAPLLDLLPAPSATRPYICGLGAMVRAVRERLMHLGWERRSLQTERYD